MAQQWLTASALILVLTEPGMDNPLGKPTEASEYTKKVMMMFLVLCTACSRAYRIRLFRLLPRPQQLCQGQKAGHVEPVIQYYPFLHHGPFLYSFL